MHVEDYDYKLPPERIAQTPVEPRDSARLLVAHRADGRIEHRQFRDLGHYLRPGDLLVANDSRVILARLQGRKSHTGGSVDVLLLRPVSDRTWEALVRGRTHVGTRITFAREGDEVAEAEVVDIVDSGVRVLRFNAAVDWLTDKIGQVPLPPYITAAPPDPERYQTVYARIAGSAAAPTAGLHFTPRLLSALESQGVGLAFVTLHIGLDTFKPMDVADPREHPIHREWCELSPATAAAINRTRRTGGRVVAVGTTAVRVLETAAGMAAPGTAAARIALSDGRGEGGRDGDIVAPIAGWTDLFLLPGHRFLAVDALLTNFHLPRSTLLLLVAAFLGKELLDTVYREALANDYRFYSFGDASLLL